VEQLARSDQNTEDEIEALAMEGINSGEPAEIGPGYWEEKHRRLAASLKNTRHQ
jgi:hypothetical protein